MRSLGKALYYQIQKYVQSCSCYRCTAQWWAWPWVSGSSGITSPVSRIVSPCKHTQTHTFHVTGHFIRNVCLPTICLHVQLNKSLFRTQETQTSRLNEYRARTHGVPLVSADYRVRIRRLVKEYVLRTLCSPEHSWSTVHTPHTSWVVADHVHGLKATADHLIAAAALTMGSEPMAAALGCGRADKFWCRSAQARRRSNKPFYQSL